MTKVGLQVLMRELAVLVAVAVTVTGCSVGTSAPASSARVVAPICRPGEHLNRLDIFRDDPAGHQVRFDFPDALHTPDRVSVRAVAADLCALKPLPKYPMTCPPDDWGAYYLLVFWNSDGPVGNVVRVDPAGCRGVWGIGPVRWGAGTLVSDLEQAFRLPAGSLQGRLVHPLPR